MANSLLKQGYKTYSKHLHLVDAKKAVKSLHDRGKKARRQFTANRWYVFVKE